mgnify:CR=1 FL=1
MTEQLGTTVSRLPVLPLRGLVAFPNMIIHFDVGRLLSIRALEAAMKNGQTLFLTAQRDLKTDNPSPSDLYQIGTICQVKQILRLPGDNIRVLVEGKQRALVHQFFAAQDDKSCIYAEVEQLEDYVYGVTERRAQALVRTAQERFAEYADNAQRISPDVELTVAEGGDAGFLADYIAQNISIEVAAKQDILEELSITRRLTMVIRLLGEETEVLKLENEIQDEVKSQMDKNQREYYLREQIKVIQTELGEQDAAAEAEAYRTRILDLKLPQECEEKLIREVDRFAKLGGSNAEQGVVRTYLDTVLDLPWRSKSEERLDLEEAQRVLDRDHYGMKKVKERIMEFLAVRSLAPNLKGQVLCLAGPPGVGKTSIAKSIAEAMGRNYARMSLGGVRDEADIRGHRKTYIGAMPGRIISAINTAKSSNPVILLDEIDKLAGDYRGDPSSALLEVLDPEQNKTFKDNYLDIPFDLSNVLFITTANDASHIPGPLYDRMDVIELPSYTRVEKFNIARRHLLPKQLKNNGLESRVTMAPAALYEIIDGYTREAGVRTLERTITAVLRKCAQKIAAGEKDKINVTPAMVKAMLGPEKVKPTFISRTDAVGIANGLAWTSVGGEMLPIEVSIIPNGSGKVEITGSLGDVMKESAHLALTYARVHAETYHIAPDKFKNTDIHIHAPEGAVPKDGPSAGVTLTTALISALSEIPVRHDLAMTGEITLHGNVLPIGGLKEKSMAAFREGISTVLIPEANKPDLYEVDEEVKKAVKFIPVSDLSQVLKHALILPAASAAHKRTMPQATQLIATEQSTAKEPAAVM